MEQRQSERVSRGVVQLARACGFSVEQIRHLAADAGTLARLRIAAPESIMKAAGVPARDAERLVDAAQLMTLPGMSPTMAASLARDDVTIGALAGGDLAELTKAVSDIPGVNARVLAGWMVPAAMRAPRPSTPRGTGRKAEVERPPALRRLVIEQEITWS